MWLCLVLPQISLWPTLLLLILLQAQGSSKWAHLSASTLAGPSPKGSSPTYSHGMLSCFLKGPAQLKPPHRCFVNIFLTLNHPWASIRKSTIIHAAPYPILTLNISRQGYPCCPRCGSEVLNSECLAHSRCLIIFVDSRNQYLTGIVSITVSFSLIWNWVQRD